MSLPAALGIDLLGRPLLRIRDWTPAEVEAVLDLADELKEKQRLREPHRPLEGRTIGLLFRKHSTRTRALLTRLPCVTMAPFERPVVPEV